MVRTGTIAMMRLDRCTLDVNGVGYVYELDASAFELLDDWQWIARTTVTPRRRTVVRAADYASWIAS